MSRMWTNGQSCMTYTAAKPQRGERVIHFVKKCPYLRFHPHPALTGGCSYSPRWEEHIFSWSHTDGRWSSWHSSPGFWKVSWQRDKEKNTFKESLYSFNKTSHSVSLNIHFLFGLFTFPMTWSDSKFVSLHNQPWMQWLVAGFYGQNVS